MRLAVFDLDGTLADTSADLIAAANAALASNDKRGRLSGPVDDLVAFAGGKAMLRLGLQRSQDSVDEEEVDALYPVLIDEYADAIAVHTRLYPGVEAALHRLSAKGWRHAICTNKPESLAEKLLKELGVRHHFAALLGADTLDVRKPHPLHLQETISRSGGRPSHSVMIGDTVTDRNAAAAAGVPCVLVGFGPAGAAVRDLAPEAILDHYDAIDEVLEAIMPAVA